MANERGIRTNNMVGLSCWNMVASHSLEEIQPRQSSHWPPVRWCGSSREDATSQLHNVGKLECRNLPAASKTLWECLMVHRSTSSCSSPSCLWEKNPVRNSSVEQTNYSTHALPSMTPSMTSHGFCLFVGDHHGLLTHQGRYQIQAPISAVIDRMPWSCQVVA